MASILSAIKTQLITDIETTSIAKCVAGISSEKINYPFAELLVFGGGGVNFDMTQVLDREFSFTVSVWAHSDEECELAIEELIKLWLSASKLAVLNALGVLIIQPIRHYPAVMLSSTTQQPIMGEVEFVMIVRYTY